MSTHKPLLPKKAEVSLVRSSAAEYLTFVAASGQGGVEAVYADESIWLTQKMMGVLYDVNVRTVNEHLKKIFADSELQEDAVIRKFRITASDGKNYDTLHYNLHAIIAVGYKVNSERAVQFRKWATGIIEQFTIKAYVMDDERIKAGGSVLTGLRRMAAKKIAKALAGSLNVFHASARRGTAPRIPCPGRAGC